MSGRKSGSKYALIAGAVFTVLAAAAAWAQTPTHISIPAQPLESALNQLSQQTGVKIVIERRLVLGLQAEKLDSTLTAEEAARILVGASGLKVEPDGSGGLVVQEPSRAPVMIKVAMVDQTATTSDPVAVQSGSETLETVIVTARKRSEDALSIPTAITAISSQDLEQRGLESIEDIANYTPGVTDLGAIPGVQHAGRDIQNIIIRGMSPSNPQTPTTSLFLNGTSVPTADMITSLDDIDHVEILKGPQSAYFGRETFAGAINVVTRTPTNTWVGEVQGEAGTRSTFMGAADFSGPIIADKLLVDFGGKFDRHDGSYDNPDTPGQTLGDQRTVSFHGGLTVKPIDNLTLKAYGLWFQDNDGPGPVGTYQATTPNLNQRNCVVAGTPFLCGTLPGLLQNPAANTIVTPAIASFLVNPGGILTDTIKGFGLKKDAYHIDQSTEYVVPDINLTFTNLFAYNQDKFSELYDLANLNTTATGPYLGHFPGIIPGAGLGLPYFLEAVSQNTSEEFRVATDASKPYRALIGYSFINVDNDNASAIAVGPPGSVNGTASPARSVTQGVFFSLAYDILAQLTIDIDGRYQSDKEYAFSSTHVITDQGSSYNFLPRASLQYKFLPDVMAYFTYSKGVNPALFNAFYGNLPEASKAEIASHGIVASTSTAPELITNYEAGLKGRFLDGRATLAADVYYDHWTNQINSGTYLFAANDPANPFVIEGHGGSVDPITFYSNGSTSVAKGVEFEGNLIPVEHVTLNLQMAYNDTKYTDYICTSCTPYATFNASGKYLPGAPLYSATFGAMYSNTINAFSRSIDWFIRADYIYRDGVWINSANTAKTPSAEVLNVRGGFTLIKGLSIEGYVNNATNNKSPTNGYVSQALSTISVGLPELITGGVKVRYEF